MRISDWNSDVCSSDLDEDDARRVALRLFEHVADAAGADADEHFDEVRTRTGEEGAARFARNRAREQRLAGAGRAAEQPTLRGSEGGRVGKEWVSPVLSRWFSLL